MADELQADVCSIFSMDSSLPMSCFGLSSPSIDWNQPLVNNNREIRDESLIHAMIQEEDLSSKGYFQQSSVMDSNPNIEAFLLDQHLLNSVSAADDESRREYGCPWTTYSQGLLDQDLKTQQTAVDYCSVNSDVLNKFPEFFKGSSVLPQKEQVVRQLHHNMSCSQSHVNQTFEKKLNRSSMTKHKTNNPDGDRNSISSAKKTSDEPVIKKPRIEMPSPLPTFNVRKEKLQDRVTALQQLVSPFGKTDTASVLFEATQYIKFLHDQVNVLSAPYLSSGDHAMQHQKNIYESKDSEGPKQDLRSRGLCIVPISSTFSVANDPVVDFWNPTFGGCYR